MSESDEDFYKINKTITQHFGAGAALIYTYCDDDHIIEYNCGGDQ